MYYTVRKANTTSNVFMDFIETLVGIGFFIHDEVLVLDNAAIHVGGECEILEDYLWTTVVDSRPLHVFVLYLPP